MTVKTYRTNYPKTPNCASCDTLLTGPMAAPAVTVVVSKRGSKRASQTSYCTHCAS